MEATCQALQSDGIDAQTRAKAGFVAINYIDCKPSYVERFECLFCTRAKAIDRMPGFLGMQVLRAHTEAEPYLIVSWWETEASFKAWVGSEEFVEGHKRGFEDLRKAKEEGKEPPMTSRFITYSVVTD
jgi:heme-degrading monooxygenase HmoA